MLRGTSAEVFYSTLALGAVSAKAGEKEQDSVISHVNLGKWEKWVLMSKAEAQVSKAYSYGPIALRAVTVSRSDP